MHACPKCDTFPFETAEELAEHTPLCRGVSRFTTVANGFGGTTAVKTADLQRRAATVAQRTAVKRVAVESVQPKTGWDYDEALAKTQAWILAHPKFSVQKFDVEDVTAKLHWLAQEYATRFTGDFAFMVDMRQAMEHFKKLTAAQAKGTLNCIRADALRNGPALPVPAGEGLDLTGLPESAHGILHLCIKDQTEGQWLFINVHQKRKNGAIVVTQEVGGHEDLYLGQQKPGARYTGKRVAELTAILADVQQAAKDYAAQSEHCSICNIKLSHEDSLARAMGPKCAARLGW